MPSIPLPQIPADATVEELAGIVGQLSKSLTWLMGATDKAFVSQDGYAGQNMLSDHSFEMIPRTGSADVDQTFAIDTAILGNSFWWVATGLPRIRSIYNTDTGVPYSLFAYQSAIVNDTNYLWQQARVLNEVQTGPYCFSVYASPKGGNTAGAKLECTLVIRALDSAGLELGAATRTFTVSESYSATDNGKWTRGLVTYAVLPANTVFLEVQVKSASAEWLEVDGAQLVPSSVPEVYNPENQLWAHLRGLDGAKHYGLHVVYETTGNQDTLIENITRIPSQSAFRAYQSTAQSIAAATWTKVAYQTVVYDHQSEYDAVNYRFTAKSDGIYVVSAGIAWASQVDGNRTILDIYKNGSFDTRLDDKAIGAATYGTTIGSASVKVALGDYLEIFAYTVNALSTSAAAGASYFEVVKVS